MFEKIAIIGCGLIGSSILRNINNKEISKSITVFDKSKDVVDTIKKENLCSEVSKDIQSAVKDLGSYNSCYSTKFIQRSFIKCKRHV